MMPQTPGWADEPAPAARPTLAAEPPPDLGPALLDPLDLTRLDAAGQHQPGGRRANVEPAVTRAGLGKLRQRHAQITTEWAARREPAVEKPSVQVDFPFTAMQQTTD